MGEEKGVGKKEGGWKEEGLREEEEAGVGWGGGVVTGRGA